jgi:hypothetical protein
MTGSQNIIAVVYDFDHTLSPHYMQDHTILRQAGIDPAEFWPSCTKLIKDKGYDQELAYMRRMLDYEAIRSLSNQDLQKMGGQLTFFPGVPDFFGELNAVVADPRYQEWDIHLEHYVVSSGLKAKMDKGDVWV